MGGVECVFPALFRAAILFIFKANQVVLFNEK